MGVNLDLNPAFFRRSACFWSAQETEKAGAFRKKFRFAERFLDKFFLIKTNTRPRSNTQRITDYPDGVLSKER